MEKRQLKTFLKMYICLTKPYALAFRLDFKELKSETTTGTAYSKKFRNVFKTPTGMYEKFVDFKK